MKLFIQLAVIAAFAAPVMAHASISDNAGQIMAKKHSKKKGKKKEKAAHEAAPAAPAEEAAAAPAGNP